MATGCLISTCDHHEKRTALIYCTCPGSAAKVRPCGSGRAPQPAQGELLGWQGARFPWLSPRACLLQLGAQGKHHQRLWKWHQPIKPGLTSSALLPLDLGELANPELEQGKITAKPWVRKKKKFPMKHASENCEKTYYFTKNPRQV